MIPIWTTYAIGLIALIIASITDLRSREVPDFLNYSLITTGLLLAAANSALVLSIWPLLNALAGLIVAYLFAATLYYTGQWGGGDAKMLMGLGALHGLPLFGAGSIILSWSWPILGTLIIAIMIAGGIYSMIYFIGLVIKKHREVRKATRELSWKTPKIITIITIASGLVGYALIGGRPGLSLLFMGLLLALGALLITLAKAVQENVMVAQTAVTKLVPGDWLTSPLWIEQERTLEAHLQSKARSGIEMPIWLGLQQLFTRRPIKELRNTYLERQSRRVYNRYRRQLEHRAEGDISKLLAADKDTFAAEAKRVDISMKTIKDLFGYTPTSYEVCGRRSIGLTETDIRAIKETKRKHILVKEGIPFIPGFLLGYLSLIILGNWIPAALGLLL